VLKKSNIKHLGIEGVVPILEWLGRIKTIHQKNESSGIA
jgi:hypothetical protein